MKSIRPVCLFAILASTLTLAQTNPVPLINQPLVPDAVAPGGTGFTLTLNGTGSVSGSVVNWNGSALTTTSVSGSQLKASVPASNSASMGEISERGIPGPPGVQGMAGVEGPQGRQGDRGATGYQGPTGAIGPAGGIRDVAQIAAQLDYVDRSIENIYKEMGSHIARMTQLQRELDALRDHVHRLAAASSK